MYVFIQKTTVLIWQGNSKAPKNYKPFTLENECKWLVFFRFCPLPANSLSDKDPTNKKRYNAPPQSSIHNR